MEGIKTTGFIIPHSGEKKRKKPTKPEAKNLSP